MPPFDRPILLSMLTYCRPVGSAAESAFIDRFIRPLPNAWRDQFDNWHVTIGDSPILWSCHTDTVHHTSDWQTLHYDAASDVVGLSRKSRRRSTCLGADDTAGVFLCHQMILAGIPGHYIFHYGEERGGFGSSDLATHRPDLIRDSRFAIALDRAGTSDVITHQCAGRCASEVFADSLSCELSRHGLAYQPSSTGVFTDTANYTGIIGECTNLSVGYARAHSRSETLDLRHVDRLFAALCQLDPSRLVSSRQPGDDEWPTWTQLDAHTFAPIHRLPFVADATYVEDCQFCGNVYRPEDSSAVDSESFCSSVCEYNDGAALARLHHQTYLDPLYADVQLALRKRFQ